MATTSLLSSLQHNERRVLSPVALKHLFDEALYSVLHSRWPSTVDDTVHLAGLLMQVCWWIEQGCLDTHFLSISKIRFGDHDPARHKLGFIGDALDTFVPAHLLHNQLRTAEWERCVQS